MSAYSCFRWLFLAIAAFSLGCRSTDPGDTIALVTSNQAGTYVPIAPIALRTTLSMSKLLMTRSFDAYTDSGGHIVASIPTGLGGSTEDQTLTRTTDVVAYTTIPVSGTDTEQLFAVIGYGARGAFSVRIEEGTLKYLDNDAQRHNRSEQSDVWQMGASGPLASILLPDEAMTVNSFKKSTRKMIAALQLEPATTVTPVLMGAMVYTREIVDPNDIAVRVIGNPIVQEILYAVDGDKGFQAAVDTAASKRAFEENITSTGVWVKWFKGRYAFVNEKQSVSDIDIYREAGSGPPDVERWRLVKTLHPGESFVEDVEGTYRFAVKGWNFVAASDNDFGPSAVFGTQLGAPGKVWLRCEKR